MHDLPGTDPRFHEPRKYLSPARVRGEEILAAHGACKEQGCSYSSAWTTMGARDRGMWTHRALKVREARVLYFAERFGDTDPRVGQLLLETADFNSHFFAPWKDLVKGFFFNLLGDDADLVLPERDYYEEYKQGHSAMDTAKFLFEHC